MSEAQKHEFKKGDEVIILIGGDDNARYGMGHKMRDAKGKVGVVISASAEHVSVKHPSFGSAISYSFDPKELRKKEEAPTPIDTRLIKNPALISHVHFNAPSDATHYNPGCTEKYLKRDEAGRVWHSGPRPGSWNPYEVGSHGGEKHFNGAIPLLVPEPVEHAIAGDPVDLAAVSYHDAETTGIQSHDELVAENESLDKQIRKLEARVERKKEFQRQNVEKIAAWQVILKQ